MTLLKMTPRRKAILDFIWRYVETNGYSPTVREIGKAAAISSTSVVAYHLGQLEAAGAIIRNGILRATTPLLKSDDILFVQPDFWPRGIGTKRRKTRRRLSEAPDGMKCIYCGIGGGVLHADHFWPLASGGTDKDYNLVPACPNCNSRKSDREPVAWCLDNYGPSALTRALSFMLSAK